MLSPNLEPYNDSRLKDLPSSIWAGMEYTRIHAAVLHAKLVDNTTLSSSSQRPRDFQRVIDAFASTALNLVWQLNEQRLPIAEYSIAGDQLSIYFYEPLDVWRSYRLDGPDPATDDEQAQLERELQERKGSLAYKALRAAIQLKNLWLAHSVNMQRLQDQLEPLGVGIGLHVGHVFLYDRPDERRRIEGMATSKARWTADAARYGKYSRLMVSREMHEILRGWIINETMLRQRVFFYQHELEPEAPVYSGQSQTIFELKFYHRLKIDRPLDVIRQYDFMFEMDPSNIWSYYELFDFHAYTEGDWEKAAQLAERAQLAHPKDEKVLLDLSRYYARKLSYEQAKHLAERALELNNDFDLVYEHLAWLAAQMQDMNAQLANLSRAMVLAPGSPANHLNYGLSLCQTGKQDEGGFHILKAITLFPGYLEREGFWVAISTLKKEGNLPAAVLERLADAGHPLPSENPDR